MWPHLLHKKQTIEEAGGFSLECDSVSHEVLLRQGPQISPMSQPIMGQNFYNPISYKQDKLDEGVAAFSENMSEGPSWLPIGVLEFSSSWLVCPSHRLSSAALVVCLVAQISHILPCTTHTLSAYTAGTSTLKSALLQTDCLKLFQYNEVYHFSQWLKLNQWVAHSVNH